VLFGYASNMWSQPRYGSIYHLHISTIWTWKMTGSKEHTHAATHVSSCERTVREREREGGRLTADGGHPRWFMLSRLWSSDLVTFGRWAKVLVQIFWVNKEQFLWLCTNKLERCTKKHFDYQERKPVIVWRRDL